MPAEPIPDQIAAYLARGWPVAPVKIDRHGGRKAVTFLTEHGFNDASLDFDLVADWCIRWPDCGWAIATGAESFLALDVDPEGLEQWEQLLNGNDLPSTYQVATPSGGQHLYFAYPEDAEIKSRAGILGDGIDVRAMGGCVFVPPTPGYERLNGAALAPLPEWLFDALTRTHGDAKETQSDPDAIASAVQALGALDPKRADIYDDWLHVGMALSELGELGLRLWENWSRRSEKYARGVCAEKWQTFRPADGLRLGHLVEWAEEDSEQVLATMPQASKHARPSHYRAAIESIGWEFRLNEANEDIEFNGAPMSNPLWALVRNSMREHGYGQIAIVHDVIQEMALANGYHPSVEYLQSLEWDGHDHISNLASHFTDKHGIFDIWIRRWLIGAVARVMGHPRGQQNRMLVLDGPQGIGKSHFVRWLAREIPELFYEGPIKTDDKDSDIRLMGVWIWELAELGATFRRSDRESLKFFISKEVVRVRKPYGREDTRRPAMANFIGTINSEGGFLSDPTGSRRFMISSLTDIKWSYTRNVPVGQLWAQAYALFRKGEGWHLLPDEAKIAAEINELYEIDDPLAEHLLDHYRVDPTKSWTTPTSEIIKTLKTDGHLSGMTERSASMSLSGILTKLGAEKERQRVDGKTTRVWRGVSKL